MIFISKRFIFVIIFIIKITNCFSQNKNDSLIYWDKNKKLKWCDFLYKGIENKGKLKVDAISFTGISISYYSTYYFKVFVYFDKNSSWTKDTISQDLLEHEQGHFDISELFGRKLRKYYSDYENGVIDQIDSTNIINIFKERQMFQDRYDYETKLGTDKIMQKRWNEIIRKELEKLKDYEVNYLEYIDE